MMSFPVVACGVLIARSLDFRLCNMPYFITALYIPNIVTTILGSEDE